MGYSIGMTKVAVVIPNWNGADFIADCLRSLEKQSLKPDIFVVDNGSVDNSVKIIKDFPKVKLLEFPDNAGFAGGVNRGLNRVIENTEYEYVALLNNDAVAEKDWLSNLVSAADKKQDVGIVTGKLMRMDKMHIDSTGEMYSRWAIPSPRGRNQIDKGQYDKGEYIFAASGGASLYRIETLQQIGLFDEDYFAYYEDVDISFRAQLAGWKVWYQPTSVAYHLVGATSSKHGHFARYHSIKNTILLYNKNMPGKLFWKYKILFFVRLAQMAAGALRDGIPHVYLKALFQGIFLIPSTLRKRRKIQSTRKVTPEYINQMLLSGLPPKIPKI